MDDLDFPGWEPAKSVQVVEGNGLTQVLVKGEPTPWGVGGAGVQAELFAREPEPQLVLPLEGCAAQFREPVSTGSEPLHIPERQRTVNSNAGGEEVGAAELGRGWQRDSYSPAQRVYLDQWEQGAYNAYAGGLLFAPLLARYQFIPTLSRIITTATHEGYSLAELALTLFYLDVFGFRSLEDFNLSRGVWRADGAHAEPEPVYAAAVSAQSEKAGPRRSVDRWVCADLFAVRPGCVGRDVYRWSFPAVLRAVSDQ